MGKHGADGKKRKNRGSTNSTKSTTSSASPHAKKHKHKHGRGVQDSENDEESDSESESDSDSSSSESIMSAIKELAKGQKHQKKILDGISKKQDNISEAVKGVETRLDRLDITLAEQGKSIEFAHGELRSLKADTKQCRDIQRDMHECTSKQRYWLTTCLSR